MCDLKTLKTNIIKSNKVNKNCIQELDWNKLNNDQNRLDALRMAIVHALGEMNRNQEYLFKYRNLDWDKEEYNKLNLETIEIQRLIQQKIADFNMWNLNLYQGDLILKLKNYYNEEYMVLFSKLNLVRLSRANTESAIASYLLEDLLNSNLEFRFEKADKSYFFNIAQGIEIATSKKNEEKVVGMIKKKKITVQHITWTYIDEYEFLNMFLKIKHPGNDIDTLNITKGFSSAVSHIYSKIVDRKTHK